MVNQNIAADGNGDPVRYSGGECQVRARGDFGGGTVTWQISDDNSEWQDVPDLEMSANGFLGFRIDGPFLLRSVMADSTDPDVDVEYRGSVADL